MGSVRKYITYVDHCAVVSECRRLLELLKFKYEEELERLSTSLSQSKSRIKDLESENLLLKTQLRDTKVLLSDSKRTSRKRAILILDCQRKNADMNRELQRTLSSLEALILFSKSLADENRMLKKMSTKHSNDAKLWNSRTRQENRRFRLLQLHTKKQETEKRQAVFKCQTKLLKERHHWSKKAKQMEERLAKAKTQNRHLREQLNELETSAAYHGPRRHHFRQ